MNVQNIVIHRHLFNRTPHIFNKAKQGTPSLNFICIEKEESRENEEIAFINIIHQTKAIAAVIDSKPFSEKFQSSLPNGFLLCRFGVGINNLCLNTLNKNNIALSTTKGASAIATAEHTFALLLGLARNIVEGHNNLSIGKWQRREGISLNGKNICILGLGNVGKEVARIARGFAMRVFALIKPYANAPEYIETFTIEQLPKYLQQSDFISLHASLTNETKNILNKEILSHCKLGALLINTARANLIDNHTLVNMLHNRTLGGAALDVYTKEPYHCPSNVLNPQKVPNLLLSPHVGCHTPSANKKNSNMIVANIINFLQGEYSKINIVNAPEIIRKQTTTAG